MSSSSMTLSLIYCQSFTKLFISYFFLSIYTVEQGEGGKFSKTRELFFPPLLIGTVENSWKLYTRKNDRKMEYYKLAGLESLED